jgi:hypothetical protein
MIQPVEGRTAPAAVHDETLVVLSARRLHGALESSLSGSRE